MRALKLVQHMKANADRMSEGLIQKIRSADRCSDLLRECQSRTTNNRALEIYRDLTDWLSGRNRLTSLNSATPILGIELANQGVPLNQRVLGCMYCTRVPLGVHAARVSPGRAG